MAGLRLSNTKFSYAYIWFYWLYRVTVVFWFDRVNSTSSQRFANVATPINVNRPQVDGAYTRVWHSHEWNRFEQQLVADQREVRVLIFSCFRFSNRFSETNIVLSFRPGNVQSKIETDWQFRLDSDRDRDDYRSDEYTFRNPRLPSVSTTTFTLVPFETRTTWDSFVLNVLRSRNFVRIHFVRTKNDNKNHTRYYTPQYSSFMTYCLIYFFVFLKKKLRRLRERVCLTRFVLLSKYTLRMHYSADSIMN